VETLILTHYVPPVPPGGGDDWRDLAAAHFDGTVEVGDDLHRVVVSAGPSGGS
jgi:ribonuclease Z